MTLLTRGSCENSSGHDGYRPKQMSRRRKSRQAPKGTGVSSRPASSSPTPATPTRRNPPAAQFEQPGQTSSVSHVESDRRRFVNHPRESQTQGLDTIEPGPNGGILRPADPQGFPRFDTLESVYRDDPRIHKLIYTSFALSVEQSDCLLRHRVHIEQNELGFGTRSFHWLWKLVVDDLPRGFRFLEVGTYKGQVTSLVGLLAHRLDKPGSVYGLTPLCATSDKYTDYTCCDYGAMVRRGRSAI